MAQKPFEGEPKQDNVAVLIPNQSEKIFQEGSMSIYRILTLVMITKDDCRGLGEGNTQIGLESK